MKNILLFVLLWTVIGTSADNLLKNGDFLQLKEGVPAHWQIGQYEKVRGTVEAVDGAGGEKAVRLSQQSEKGWQQCYQSVWLKRPLGKARRAVITVEVGGDRLKHGYMVVTTGNLNKAENQWRILQKWSGSFKRKTEHRELILNAGTRQVTVSVRTSRSGGALLLYRVSLKLEEEIEPAGGELMRNGILQGKLQPSTGLPPDWKGQMYPGEEAVGRVSWRKEGHGASGALQLAWISGGHRFGAETLLKAVPPGRFVYRATAWIRTAGKGKALLSARFYQRDGRLTEEIFSSPLESAQWKQLQFEFVTLSDTVSIGLCCLSGAGGEVFFSDISCRRLEKEPPRNQLPLEARLLPVDHNKVWNDGKYEFISFAEAPLPLTFHFKGQKKELQDPELTLDIPEELSIADAFCMYINDYGRETPRVEAVQRSEGKYRRYHFQNIRPFRHLLGSYAWGRKLVVVIAPAGNGKLKESYPVFWRLADRSRKSGEHSFRFCLAELPPPSEMPRNFPVFRWLVDDFLYTDDALLSRALTALERSGLNSSIRYDRKFSRGQEINRLLEKRNWRHWVNLVDCTWLRFIPWAHRRKINDDIEYCVSENGLDKIRFCPDYFVDDPAFVQVFKDSFREYVERRGVKTGEFVVQDIEPWGTMKWCFCLRSRQKFASWMGLPYVPDMAEIKEKHAVQWARFRCENTAEQLRLCRQVLREYFPGVKMGDFDYAVEFDKADFQKYYQEVAKDPELNEESLDAHLTSYYNHVDQRGFARMKTNIRRLKKDYYPVCAIDGPGYLSPENVLNPARIRLMALAAAVNGASGLGIYPGENLDGSFLLSLSRSMGEIAVLEQYFQKVKRDAEDVRIEALPYQRREVAVENQIKVLTFPRWEEHIGTRAVRHGKERMIALFNYHAEKELFVKISAELPAGRYAVLFPTVKRRFCRAGADTVWTDKDLRTGFKASVLPCDAAFILIRPVAENPENWPAAENPSDLERRFEKARRNAGGGVGFNPLKAGNCSVAASDIDQDGRIEIQVTAPSQILWIDYQQGAVVRQWKIGDRMFHARWAVDALWMPQEYRSPMLGKYRIGKSVIEKGLITIPLTADMKNLPLRIHKIFRVRTDRPEFRVDYEVENTGRAPYGFCWRSSSHFPNDVPEGLPDLLNRRGGGFQAISDGKSDLVYAMSGMTVPKAPVAPQQEALEKTVIRAKYKGLNIDMIPEIGKLSGHFYWTGLKLRTAEWIFSEISLDSGQRWKCVAVFRAAE